MLEQGFAAAAGAAARMSDVAPVDPAGILMLVVALGAIVSMRLWSRERARETGRVRPVAARPRAQRFTQP
jgi:hypothetical protein